MLDYGGPSSSAQGVTAAPGLGRLGVLGAGQAGGPQHGTVLTRESKVSLVQAKRWLLMPRVVKTHSSLGCSTAFSAGRVQAGGCQLQPDPHPCPQPPPAPWAPPDEAMVTRMRASSRALCSSEYCSFSVTEARMSCTEAERRLRMVTYEWSGMYTRQKTGERGGGGHQGCAGPLAPPQGQSGALSGETEARSRHSPCSRQRAREGTPAPDAVTYSHRSLEKPPASAGRSRCGGNA